jgi:hypothetical protein
MHNALFQLALALVSSRHSSPHTCVLVSKTSFLPAALDYFDQRP